MHLQAKHFQKCLREAYPEREPPTPPSNPAKWMKLVELVQLMWENETSPTHMGCTILVLIPKGNAYN